MLENVNKTIHLNESDLELPSLVCLVCKSSNLKQVDLLQQAPNVELLHCEACGVTSASRMPIAATLNKFYQRYYQTDFYQNRKERVAVVAPKRLADHIFKLVKKCLTRKKICIIDFGGGDGSVALRLAVRLLSKGYAENVHIVVIDYDLDSIVATDIEAITITKQRYLEENLVGACDIVLASAILEHVTDPKTTLENLLNTLRSGGAFYARTPYIVPLRQLLKLFGVTYDFTYPAHLHDMGARYWNQVLTTLRYNDRYNLLSSQPSFVETLFSTHFFQTLVAYSFKTIWYVVGDAWPFVGGWEVVIQRR